MNESHQLEAPFRLNPDYLPDFMYSRIVIDGPTQYRKDIGLGDIYHLESMVSPDSIETSRYQDAYVARYTAIQRPVLLLKNRPEEIKMEHFYVMVGMDLPSDHRNYYTANIIVFEANLIGMQAHSFLPWFSYMKEKFQGIPFRITTPWGDAPLNLANTWFPSDRLPLIDDGTMSCRVIALLSTGDQAFLRVSQDGQWIDDLGNEYDNVQWWTPPPESCLARG